MTSILISILAALSVVVIITVLGLILAQILIHRANKTQTHMNIISEQSQGIVVDIDELPDAQNEAGITVISNDVIEGTSHRHHHLTKKTISVIDQDAQINNINNKNTTIKHIHPSEDLTISTETDNHMFLSDTNMINPLTDKITLEY